MQANLALVLIFGVLLSSVISGCDGVIGPFPTLSVRRPKVKSNEVRTCTHERSPTLTTFGMRGVLIEITIFAGCFC